MKISIRILLISYSLALPLGVNAANNDSGEVLFKRYCIGCHGLDVKGVSSSSKRKYSAADLTLLAKNNNGHFPYLKIRSAIDGRAEKGKVRAHYGNDMPVWGREFSRSKTLAGQISDEAIIKMRILNLVDFLASIQQ